MTRMETSEEWLPLSRVLSAYWKTLVACGAVAAGAAAVVNFFVLKPAYGATAYFLIASDRLDLTFDPKFRNIPQDRPDLLSRRRALEDLAESPAVVGQVLELIRSKLQPEEQDPLVLKTWMDVTTSGEVLKIHALTRDPALSAEVANAWGAALRKLTSSSMGARDPDPEVTEAQAREAQQSYAAAEKALVSFVQQDRTVIVASQLRRKRTSLEEAQLAAVRLQKVLRDVEEVSGEFRSEGGGARPASQARRLQLLQVALSALECARELGVPVSEVPDSAGSRVPDARSGPSLTLQVPWGSEDSPLKADSGFQDELASLERQVRRHIEALEKMLNDPRVTKEILELQGELEILTGRKRELTHARDLAWDTYGTVSRKVVETRLAAGVGTAVIRSASDAVADARPERPRKLLNILVSAAAGCVVAFLAVCLGPARPAVFGKPAAEATMPTGS